MAIFLVAAGVLASVGTIPTQAVAANSDLEYIGVLPNPGDDFDNPSDLRLLAIDPDRRRLYGFVIDGYDDGVGSLAAPRKRLVEYDLDSEIPQVRRLGPGGATQAEVLTPYTVAIDSARNRMLILGLGSGTRSQIDVIDLDTLSRVAVWDLSAELPGFFGLGLQIHPETGRVYVAGNFTGTQNATIIFGLAGSTQLTPGASIVALDGQSGSLRWVDSLTGCDAPMGDATNGALIAISKIQPAMYIFCPGGQTSGQSTGQNGLIRLDTSTESDASGLVDFPMEFFPVSGHYAATGQAGGGVAAFDHEAERFFAHSVAPESAGAWVFDGLQNSWSGFVAAQNSSGNLVAVDEGTGKHYLVHAEGAMINITDGRATPRVPTGQLLDAPLGPFEETAQRENRGMIRLLVDPQTSRLFADVGFVSEGDSSRTQHTLVLRDQTPLITPLTDLDYDALTSDLPDDEVFRDPTAGAFGFGAKYIAVGGWENFYSRIGPPSPLLKNVVALLPSNPTPLAFGPRGSTFASVNDNSISVAGSSASARAARPDASTEGDIAGQTSTLPETDPEDDAPTGESVATYREVTCLDGVGEPIDNADGAKGDPAYAIVRCDLSANTTTSTAAFSEDVMAGGVGVGSSSFDTRSYVDPKLGAVTETVAVAEGIAYGFADLGAVTIDRVTTRVVTSANGRPGTAAASWERTIEGAQLVDANGPGPSQSCRTVVVAGKAPEHEGDCESLETQINDLMKNRLRTEFPLPAAEATPKGASASIGKTAADQQNGWLLNDDNSWAVPAMEVTVFSDSTKKGRLVVQLAAVRAVSQLLRTPKYVAPVAPPGNEGGALEGPVAEDPEVIDGVPVEAPAVEVPVSADDPQALPVPIDLVSHNERLVGAFGWLANVRSLGDGVLTGLLYTLVLLPLLGAGRRRRLLALLATDSSGGDLHESSGSP